jgi:DNA invertase Pin-like site-specific DNA recombinase
MSRQPLGHPYLRFSSRKQRHGDSVRRQTEDTVAGMSPATWCENNKVILSLKTYRDMGLSAWKGANVKQGDLKLFLEAIKVGEVRPGDFLLVEKLDRISRQGVDEGMDVIKEILRAGVKIVTLCNGRVYDRQCLTGLTKGLLELQIMLEQAKEYSDNLSRRVASSKERLRQDVRAGRKLMTRKLPGWVRVGPGGKLELIPEHAQTVGLIFRWAIEGHGLKGIMRKLSAAGTPPMGRKAYWNKTYVRDVLTSRAVLGEFQPCRFVEVEEEAEKGNKITVRKRVPDGDPIPDYFPRVVSDDDFVRAQAGLKDRKHKVGRQAAETVNVFKGLLRDARSKGSCVLALRVGGSGRRCHVIVPADADQARAGGVSFPFATFERAVLTMLREVKPSEILPPAVGKGEDDTLALSRELEAIKARIALAETEFDTSDEDEALIATRRIKALLAKQKEVAGKLAEARQRAASPLSESWGEFKTLLEALDGAPDRGDALVRLRGAMARVVDSIWILATGKGAARYCDVQINFVGTDVVRFVAVFHRPPTGGSVGKRAGFWWARSRKGIVYGDLGDLSKLTPERAEAEALSFVEWVDLSMPHSMSEDSIVETDGPSAWGDAFGRAAWGEIPLPQSNPD